MLWRDVGLLCTEEIKLDSLKKPYKVLVKREIFCNKKSVRQNEFYQAQAQGYRPEIMFEIRSSAYDGESYFEYNGKQYRIIRTFDKNGEIMELICNALVAGNG